jgi:molybdate transport system substrate-binding protein
MRKIALSFIVIALILSGCSDSKNKKVELTISAAASMRGVLTEIKERYEQENQNVELFFNFGASGALQKQIEQGAPVDLFLSAALDNFIALREEGLIHDEHQIELVSNQLVLIQGKDSAKELEGLSGLTHEDIHKIAIGTPETVPAGKYAEETLEKLHLWNELQGKLILAKDVRQVLTYVETNNVDAGIVYNTDAIQSPNIKIVEHIDPKTHSSIIYPLAVINKTKHEKEAAHFFSFLQSQQAKRIFEKHGFIFLPQ